MSEHPSPAPVVDVRPLRFVWFGRSVMSDMGNPAATTTRAVLRALASMGQHAVFLEERGNQPITELLRTHGAEPLRAFTHQFPDIAYRTYDLPGGRERLVWLGRELAVADAVIVQDTAPAGVIEALREGTAPHVVRVAQLTTQQRSPFDADLVVAPAGTDAGLAFGPAVMATVASSTSSRTGVVVVAYGDLPLATRIADRLAPLGTDVMSAGPAASPAVPFVPEVDLPDRYAGYAAAVVVNAGPHPLAAARALLPLVAGCATFVAGEFPSRPAFPDLDQVDETTALAAVTRQLESADGKSAPQIPPQFDAAIQADHLVRDIRAIRYAALTSANGVHEQR